MILQSQTYQKELEKIADHDFLRSALKEKKILITGAAGLIGSAIADVLMKINEKFNCQIKITCMCRNEKKALERFAPYLKSEDFILKIQDVCEPIDCGPEWDYMIHAAGNAHPAAFVAQPVETMKANLLGTVNLLEHSKQQKKNVEKFLYISSGEIYGHSQEEIFTEETFGMVNTMQPRSCYPESKRAAETFCISYAEEYGVKINVARLGYIYGPGFEGDNTRADVQFLKKAMLGEDIILKSEGGQLRSYCYIMDAVYGLFMILLFGEKGEAYNLADDRSVVTIRELAETIAKYADVSVKFDVPKQTEQVGYSRMQREILDIEKLKKIGWQPVTNVKAGIQNTLEILKESLIEEK